MRIGVVFPIYIVREFLQHSVGIMDNFKQLIDITTEDFNRLKEDVIDLEKMYFDEPFIREEKMAKVDYKETIRLISTARNLSKLNIKLDDLYDKFHSFTNKESVSGDGDREDAQRLVDASDGKGAKRPLNGNVEESSMRHVNGNAKENSKRLVNENQRTVSQVVTNDYLNKKRISNNASNVYKEFLFGQKNKQSRTQSRQMDFHSKDKNVNITNDLFRKIVVEILDYEKNYNEISFSTRSLQKNLIPDILKNGKEVLLPYVISNVLTYLKDSNFIGLYGADRKSKSNSYAIMDKEGLKLWVNSIP